MSSSIFRFEYMEIFVKYLLGYLLLRSIIFNVIGILRSLLALKWVKVPVSLTYTNIEESRAVEGMKFCAVDIWFSYSYESENFTSKQYAFNYSNSPLLSLHKLTVKRLKNRKQVFARVNPKNPNQAVIFSGVKLFHIVNICLPIISGPYQFIEVQALKKLVKS